MRTIKQHQGEETVFLSILFNCGHFGTTNMKSDDSERTAPKAFCSCLKMDKEHSVEVFSSAFTDNQT